MADQPTLSDPSAGALLGGRYRLVDVVGRGGMATVWSAEDTVLGRRVAIKVLHGELRRDPAQVRRFHQEAVSSARVTHPGVIAVYDQLNDDVDAIVMELVEGRSLRQHLAVRSPMPVEQALDIAIAVADALVEAHQRGVVHRDLTPANILLGTDGTVKLADFGIAKLDGAADDLTATGTLVGTAAYLAPEQLQGGPIDARTDVYALGGVLYSMLCGRPPFQGGTEAERATARLTRDPTPPRRLRPELPPDVAEVVMRALSRTPADRFATADDLRAALVDARLRSGSQTAQGRRSKARASTRPAAGVTGPARPGAPAGPVRPASPTSTSTGRPPVRKAHSRTGLVVLTALIGGAALLLLALVAGGGEAPRDTDRTPTPSTRAAVTQPIPLGSPSTFDPEGRGTPGENDDRVGALTDGDLATKWRTETYRSPTFGTKSGVGVVVPLLPSSGGGAWKVTRVVVRTPTEGWTAKVYLLDSTGPPSDLPPVAAATATARAGELSVDLDPATARQVLVWITDLGPSGPPHRVEIAEITVDGRPA